MSITDFELDLYHMALDSTEAKLDGEYLGLFDTDAAQAWLVRPN